MIFHKFFYLGTSDRQQVITIPDNVAHLRALMHHSESHGSPDVGRIINFAVGRGVAMACTRYNDTIRDGGGIRHFFGNKEF